MVCNKKKFKLPDYIPKDVTQQPEFLKHHPEFDGKGLLIAIIDSAVDVSLPGLQKTTTGLPKILDCFDFTGAGNVNTTDIKETDENNILIGLSGRKLKIPSTWRNPSGKWHLGKESYNKLSSRKAFERMPEIISSGTQNDDLKNSNLKMENVSDATTLPFKDSEVDCIVWFDGDKWQACVDISFSEDLENAKMLTNFRDNHEFAFINDEISYCITIHDNGNLLEIFSSYNQHGTFVAHIAAGHFSDEPEKDGLAPGAQIVSMNVFRHSGFTINFCEVLKKALLTCIKIKVDIVNLSFVFKENREIDELFKEMYEKHGIIVLQAAGNVGPLHLSLNRSNENVHHCPFIIGSILTAEMNKHLFLVKDDIPPITFAHSSRGLMYDGSRGVTFTAPGAAITALPKWSWVITEIRYGTSFACANAAGSIACLLSALKSNSIKYTPSKIKLALSNTAYLPNEDQKMEFGEGIIQICAGYEYFKTYLTTMPITTPQVSLQGMKMKGIFVIKKHCNETFKPFYVKIKQNNFGSSKTQWTLKLFPENKNFVKFSKSVTKSVFSVEIDTCSIIPGSINYAEIHGIDSSNPSLGPLFYLPVTVIIPENVSKTKNYCIQKNVCLEREIPCCVFFYPPFESQKCQLKITLMNEEEEISSNVIIRYSAKDDTFSSTTKVFYFTEQNKEQNVMFSIQSQKMYELSIYRSCMESSEDSDNIMLKLEISFDV